MKESTVPTGIIKATVVTLLAICALSFSVNSQAATLKTKFRDSNNDLICVYNSHGHDVYVNAGFSGYCSFNIPDSQLEDD